MASEYTAVAFDDAERVESSKSGVSRIELTARLDCEKLATRVWYLDPGESLVYHRQREQEELYVPLEGPGQMRIDDEIVEVPARSAVRVPPETPRQPINESDRQHVWLIVGAPKVADDGIYVEDAD
jgi:mannose-6-phosphate isomerase-like protein (cupin superfamily)